MPRKGENIYKRKDGRWEGRYIKGRTPGGKAYYGYVYAGKYRDAKMKLQAAIQKTPQETACNTVLSSIPFSEIAQEWLLIKKSQNKESTYIKYRNLISAYITPYIGDKAVSTITNAVIDGMCTQLAARGGKKEVGISQKTIADTVSVIRNLMRFAAEKGYQTGTDAKSVIVKGSVKDMSVLTQSEQSKLCACLYGEPSLKNMGILICMFTGIRIGELCALKWEDISFSEKTVYIHRTMQRIQTEEGNSRTKVIVTVPKSKCSFRTIPLADSLIEMLHAFRGSNTAYLLSGYENQIIEPRSMQNHFKRVLKKCFIPDANFHALRHTFATRCIESGFDIKSLSEILGHASVNITLNRYVHPSIELKRSNVERLSEFLAVKQIVSNVSVVPIYSNN